MQNFQRSWDARTSAGSKAKGVISGVGKGIVGVFTKPIGGAAELVSQTGFGGSGAVDAELLLFCSVATKAERHRTIEAQRPQSS